MNEYSVIRAPDFYTDTDAMRVWLKAQSAIGEELVCSYSDGWGRPIFVFLLTPTGPERDEDERGCEIDTVWCPVCDTKIAAGVATREQNLDTQ